MKRSLAEVSLFLFGLSVVFWIGMTAVEAAIAGFSSATERIITFVLLVLPPGIGAVLGMMSLLYREKRSWQAIAGLLLNAAFALLHLAVILFAG